jgi:hypothetical protein
MPAGPAKFMSYLKEVHALRIVFRHCEDIATGTFPLVQIGPSDFNMKHPGTIPLLSSGSSQCIGHVHIMVQVSFPDLDAFQELECHVAHTTANFHYLGSAANGEQPGKEAEQDAVDAEADALLEPLFQRLRSKKGQPKEENVDAQQADIFALVHAAFVRYVAMYKAVGHFVQCVDWAVNSKPTHAQNLSVSCTELCHPIQHCVIQPTAG